MSRISEVSVSNRTGIRGHHHPNGGQVAVLGLPVCRQIHFISVTEAKIGPYGCTGLISREPLLPDHFSCPAPPDEPLRPTIGVLAGRRVMLTSGTARRGHVQ